MELDIEEASSKAVVLTRESKESQRRGRMG